MRKLEKLHLLRRDSLNSPQMKSILGGIIKSDCSASCGNSCEPVSITNCVGICTAEDGVGVTCTGETKILSKPCCGVGGYY